jgi:LacI family transcriptional regulator, galactose operon repressor
VVNGWDVARRAGVSQATVSRVMRGDSKVAPQTRELVLRAAEELGYAPDTAAQALITRRTSSVAVVVPDLANPLYPQLITAAQAELHAAGYRMFLLNARFGDVDEHVRRLRGRTVDGVLLATSIIDSPTVAEFLRRGLPTALVIRGVEGVAADTFIADDETGCALAADHLTGLGHRRIGMISGPANTTSGRDRVRLFRVALRRDQVELPESLVAHSPYTFDSGAELALRLLGRAQRPTALFCASDVLAFGAVHAIRRAGLRVPGDVSVVGFDDVAMAGWEMIGLTTIRQPIEQMARESVRTLLGRISGEDASPRRRHVFAVELVERGTTGPVR